MRCFHCQNIQESGTFQILEKGEADHLFRTLRGRVGDEVELIDGNGTKADAVIEEGERLRVLKKIHHAPSVPSFHLFFSPVRGSHSEEIVRHAVELGISSIRPVLMRHSVSRPESERASKRWRTIAVEACKQSKNPFLPELGPILSFSEMLDTVRDDGFLAYFGDCRNESAAVQDESGSPPARVAWIVGPEGGFAPDETDALERAGCRPLRIGRHVLRAETAALCGLAVLLHLHGTAGLH